MHIYEVAERVRGPDLLQIRMRHVTGLECKRLKALVAAAC